MHSERAQIVMKVQPLTNDDKSRVIDSLLQLESVRSAYVDVFSGIVRVDGAASDFELIRVMEGLGKQAVVVTHTRGVAGSARGPPSSSGTLKVQLFMKLLKRQVSCCD